ncbi:MAG: LysR family transcriptional regulator [Pigmentiphaga sp.]
MVNLKTLEAFFWIVELGGFRKAAEKLHTTQPAVSARIAQLEDVLQVRLLDRNQGSTVPTAKGAELLAYARRMLDLHSEMIASIAEQDVTRGTVRMGVTEVIASSWGAELITDLARVYPLLNLEVEFDSSPNLHIALLAGQFDIIFADGPLKQPAVENVVLDTYGLNWVASSSLKLKEPLTLEDVAPLPIITFARTTSAYLGMSELRTYADQRSIRIYSIESLPLAAKLVKAGVGVGVLPRAGLSEELESGVLRLIESSEKLPAGSFSASYRKGPQARVVSAIASLASTYANKWRNSHPLP